MILRPLNVLGAALAATGLCVLMAGLLPAQTAPARPTSKKDEAPQKLEPVEVTGSRIKRVEAEGPSPIKIVQREELEFAGRATLSDALRDLPEAGFTNINESGTTAAVRGSMALNLRDLGANNTLIIVNGRRAVLTAADSGGTTFVDLNRFPVAMVERVEVLKDGASAIYGSDATAGVVNIILRRDYDDTEVRVSYGNSTRTDRGEVNWSLFTGKALGKFSATLGLSYYTRGELRARDTDFAANADLSWRYVEKDWTYWERVVDGFYDLRSGTGPHARILGVHGVAINGQNGVNIPGLPLGFRLTRLPGTGGVVFGLGTTATPSFTNPPATGSGGQYSAALTATYVPPILTPFSDPSNLYNFQEMVWLTPRVQRAGGYTTMRYDLTPDIHAYAEFSYQRNKSRIELAAPPISTNDDNQIFVPRTNYWNPFGVDVAFAWRPVDFGPRRSDVTIRTHQLLTGLKGRWRQKWDWDAAYSRGRDDKSDRTANAISESRLRAALARTTANALNIFGGSKFLNDPAIYREIQIATENSGYSTLDLADGRVSGDLFEGPTGIISAAGSLEWRRERFGERNDEFSSTLDDVIAQVQRDQPNNSRRTVESVSGELRLPLVKPDTYPLLYKADLSVAARFEDFSDGYNSGVKPYFGLRYQPIRDLVLRGSFSRSFRAPTLPQLYGGVRDSLNNNLPDLRRPQSLTGDPFDGSATQRLVRFTGNAELTPEHATSYQFGLVYDVPFSFLKGINLGATFFHIEQRNVITSVGTSYIRLNEVGGGTAELIVRDPTPEFYVNNSGAAIPILAASDGRFGELPPGQGIVVPGRIRYIRDSIVNLAYQQVEGFDFELNYVKRSPRFGRFSFRSGAQYLKSYGFTRTTELENFVGRAGAPRVRVGASLVWTRREWTAGFTQLYTGETGDFNRDGFEVDDYYPTGLFVGYDIPPGRVRYIENTRVTFGLDNVFDQRPPLYADAVGYDQNYVGRPAGRYWFLGLRRAY
jgi:iron complex outermembrane receptor protein